MMQSHNPGGHVPHVLSLRKSATPGDRNRHPDQAVAVPFPDEGEPPKW